MNTKEDDVRERIQQLQKMKKLTENRLSGGDPPTQKRLNRQLSHGASITLDTLLRILAACPDISADWLLRGTGDMYAASGNMGANSVTGKGATVIGQQMGTMSESFVCSLLAEKDKQIETLMELLKK